MTVIHALPPKPPVGVQRRLAAALHGEQSFPIVTGDDVGDPLLQLLQQGGGLLSARGSFGRFGCCHRGELNAPATSRGLEATDDTR